MSDKDVSSIAAHVDLLIKIGPWIFGLIVLLIVWWRTGSLHYLVHRLFQTLGATRTFHSKKAQRQWDAYEDLQQHNLWHGLRLKTFRQLNAFQTWLDVEEIGVEEVCRARWYFNANKLEFDIPSPRRVVAVRSVVCGIFLSFFLIVSLFGNYQKALLKVNKTETWFWVGQGTAHGFTGRIPGLETWTLDAAGCKTAGDAPLGNAWDKEVICKLVSGERAEYVDQTLESQRFVVNLFSLVDVFIGLACWRLLISELAARRLARRLGRIS